MTDTALSGQPGAAPADRPADLPKPTTPVGVRERLLDLLRRDLVGPHPDLDLDLAREVLTGVAPSTWYLSGFLGPRPKTGTARRVAAATGSDAAQEEAAEDLLEAQRGSEGLSEVAAGRGDAPDGGSPEAPPARSFQPSSLGLTVLLPRDARQLQARLTWGSVSATGRSKLASGLAALRPPIISAARRTRKRIQPSSGLSSTGRAAALHRRP
jgi:hypothetical protein